jgi:hypothetical protein
MVRIGPLDPIGLTFAILNKLMKKKILTLKDVRGILGESLDANLSKKEKNKIIDSLFKNSAS